MNWATRTVLSWRLSNTQDSAFCREALQEALARYGRPEIFNTDQGSQFTSREFTEVLEQAGVAISMDGKGRWRDNVLHRASLGVLSNTSGSICTTSKMDGKRVAVRRHPRQGSAPGVDVPHPLVHPRAQPLLGLFPPRSAGPRPGEHAGGCRALAVRRLRARLRALRVCFPAGSAWLRRDCMTRFVRSMREMLLQIGEARRRPMLLAARLPENLAGCRFDGLDVETWAREELIDLLVPGVRSLEVDLVDFRRICRGTQVRLYPSIDDHHASDGYQNPGIELFRWLAATWRRDRADGLHPFNFNFGADAPYAGQDWRSPPAGVPGTGQPGHHPGQGQAVRGPAPRRRPRPLGDPPTRRTGRHPATATPTPTCWRRFPPTSQQRQDRHPAPPARRGRRNDGRGGCPVAASVALGSQRRGASRKRPPSRGGDSNHRPCWGPDERTASAGMGERIEVRLNKPPAGAR